MNVFDVPSGLNHTEFIHLGGPDGVRLRDYDDVVQVHLEALLGQDAEEVEAAVQATLGWPVRVGWYS
jgi:hypothetical protein